MYTPPNTTIHVPSDTPVSAIGMDSDEAHALVRLAKSLGFNARVSEDGFNTAFIGATWLVCVIEQVRRCIFPVTSQPRQPEYTSMVLGLLFSGVNGLDFESLDGAACEALWRLRGNMALRLAVSDALLQLQTTLRAAHTTEPRYAALRSNLWQVTRARP